MYPAEPSFSVIVLGFYVNVLYFIYQIKKLLTNNKTLAITMDAMDFDTQNLSDDQQHQVLFMMLVQQHQQIAMMGMGKIKNPGTGEINRDMKSARFAIDTLLMIQEFTKGNITDDLKNYLQETLTNLRLNYADEMKKGDPDPSEEPIEDKSSEPEMESSDSEKEEDDNK